MLIEGCDAMWLVDCECVELMFLAQGKCNNSILINFAQIIADYSTVTA